MRPKPTWHAEAQRLRAQGLTQREIALRLGKTQGAVNKALNPERAAEHSRRANAKPKRQAAKRAWDRARAEERRRSRRDEIDPEIPGLLPIWNAKREIVDFARVDIADWEVLRQHRFSLRAGYAATGRNVYLHHLLLGHLPREDGLQADHINRDRLDDRRANLRVVTSKENNANRGGKYERCWERQIAA